MLHEKKTSPRDITIKDGLGNAAPLSLTWDDQDVEDDAPFIPVYSRRKKKKSPKKDKVVVSSPNITIRPMNRKQKKELRVGLL